jgi:hypothetical protein
VTSAPLATYIGFVGTLASGAELVDLVLAWTKHYSTDHAGAVAIAKALRRAAKRRLDESKSKYATRDVYTALCARDLSSSPCLQRLMLRLALHKQRRQLVLVKGSENRCTFEDDEGACDATGVAVDDWPQFRCKKHLHADLLCDSYLEPCTCNSGLIASWRDSAEGVSYHCEACG